MLKCIVRRQQRRASCYKDNQSCRESIYKRQVMFSFNSLYSNASSLIIIQNVVVVVVVVAVAVAVVGAAAAATADSIRSTIDIILSRGDQRVLYRLIRLI